MLSQSKLYFWYRFLGLIKRKVHLDHWSQFHLPGTSLHFFHLWISPTAVEYRIWALLIFAEENSIWIYRILLNRTLKYTICKVRMNPLHERRGYWSKNGDKNEEIISSVAAMNAFKLHAVIKIVWFRFLKNLDMDICLVKWMIITVEDRESDAIFKSEKATLLFQNQLDENKYFD